MPRSTGETLGVLSRILSLPGDLGASLGSGILSSAYNAAKAPGDAYLGKIAPEDMVARGNEVALNMGGGGSLASRPRGSLGMFGGPNAKTADLRKLEMAKEWKARGMDPDTITRGTGWSEGAGGQWQFEISDHASKMKGDMSKRGYTSDVFDHPDLYAAYPELAQGSIGPLPPRHQKRGLAGVNHGGNKISLNPMYPEQARGTTLHELGHSVQDIEGWPRGSSPRTSVQRTVEALLEKNTPEARGVLKRLLQKDTPSNINKKIYNNAMGEVEARNIQTRMDMTPLERAMNSPIKTEDVPRAKQIMFGNSSGESASMAKPPTPKPSSSIERTGVIDGRSIERTGVIDGRWPKYRVIVDGVDIGQLTRKTSRSSGMGNKNKNNKGDDTWEITGTSSHSTRTEAEAKMIERARKFGYIK